MKHLANTSQEYVVSISVIMYLFLSIDIMIVAISCQGHPLDTSHEYNVSFDLSSLTFDMHAIRPHIKTMAYFKCMRGTSKNTRYRKSQR